MTNRPASQDAGFTLIEVVISLALFALISMAGIALVDAVVRVEERTSGRLERLGQLQRAMFMLTRDLEQISSGSLEQVNGGIRFTRHPASVYEAGRAISYSLRGDSLLRTVGGEASGTTQRLVRPVSSLRWNFFFADGGWQDEIPVDDVGKARAQPVAVAVDILLAEGGSLSGSLRRVVELSVPTGVDEPSLVPASSDELPPTTPGSGELRPAVAGGEELL